MVTKEASEVLHGIKWFSTYLLFIQQILIELPPYATVCGAPHSVCSADQQHRPPLRLVQNADAQALLQPAEESAFYRIPW